MNNFFSVSEADILRTPTAAMLPDVRTDYSVVIRSDGEASKFTLADQYELIGKLVLNDAVPLDVRVHFETAKNLYLYAWFVYRFYPVAEKHVLATLEFALRERLTAWRHGKNNSVEKVPRGLGKLISLARLERLISNNGLRANERLARQRTHNRVVLERIREMESRGLTEMIFSDSPAQPLPEDYERDSLKIFEENLPKIRNDYAHGSATLHDTVWGTFEIVTDLVNQLFPMHGESR